MLLKNYIQLFRVKHYIKNLLVFFPMFFGGVIFDVEKLISGSLGFLCFCLLSSAVYILNDYRDMENDRNHPKKKERPLANGTVKPRTALLLMLLCLLVVICISLYLADWKAAVCLILYFALNAAYSMGLKNMPVIDVLILASGFVIRIFYGGFITDVGISKWLYLVVTAGSLYMGLGKRRNELKKQADTRDVLQYYNVPFLDKNMYVCVALADVFYALWTIEMPDSRMSWTVPGFIVLLMCYSLNAEGDSDGDPVEVILHDKLLIGVIIAYAACIFTLLYLF